MTLYESFAKCAKENPERTAMVFYGGRISFGGLLELVDRAAGGLNDLVARDEIVTLCMPNSPSAAIAFYAVNKLGGVVNLTHPLIKKDSLVSCMNKVGSKLLITYDLFDGRNDMDCKMFVSDSSYFMGGVAKMYYRFTNRKKRKGGKRFEDLFGSEPMTEVRYASYASVFLPSGGSTGEPKVIMHSDASLNGLCEEAQFFLSEPISNYNAMYSVLPIFHGFGLCMNMHMCMTKGITSVMTLRFNAKDMSKAIKKEKVNILTGVPAMYNKLLGSEDFHKADLSDIKECFVGGDSASPELIERFNEALKRGGSKAELFEGYGLTETVTVCAVNTQNKHKKGSAGYPLPNTRLAITDGNKLLESGEVGELVIDTPLMMLGYYGTDEMPVKEIDGKKWLRTGDLCYIDSDGFLFFKQRVKNMIKVSGVPVFPSEVESVVSTVKGVKLCAAIGIPDEIKGESVKLIVEKGDIGEQELREAIEKVCKEKLIVYARPKVIEFKTIPLNQIGKVDRKQLH